VEHLPPAAAESIPGLIATIDARDGFTARHSADVGRMCRWVALELGWPDRDVRAAHLAGLVHDVGRVGLPDAVLGAPGRLSEEQWTAMRRHPDRGADLLAALGVGAEIVAAVRSHHERWDGSGYPRALRATDAPRLGRLVGLCEAFDAMTAPRPQGRAKPHGVARDEIALEAGILFDPEMAEALLDVAGARRIPAGDFAEQWVLAGSTATPAASPSERNTAVPRTRVDRP
jgi:HD-GYP domain-containing protein (c-di-GMP phosphodiesterase class II)